MSTGAFDTLTAAHNLESADKFSRDQAEAIAQAIRDGKADLATKGDISWLRWGVGIAIAVSLANLAGVLTILNHLLTNSAP